MNPSITELPQFVAKGIKYVALSNTGVRDLSCMKNYTKITRLMLEGLKLTEVPKFIENMRLDELWLGNNEITQISNLSDQP